MARKKKEVKEEVVEAVEEKADIRLTREDIIKAKGRLRNYKDYKKPVEERIRANEEWWRLRHWAITRSEKEREEVGMAEPVSAWLHNSINNRL